MTVWTRDQLAALRHRGIALREMLSEPDLTELAAEHERRTLLDVEQEQAIGAAYVAGLDQGQQLGHNPDSATEIDPYVEIDADL